VVSVKDIEGQEVYNEKVSFILLHDIDVSRLNNGIYFITLQNDKERFVSKFVVQR